jgi:hypothetical protein
VCDGSLVSCCGYTIHVYLKDFLWFSYLLNTILNNIEAPVLTIILCHFLQKKSLTSFGMNPPFCRPRICTVRSIAPCHPITHALSPDTTAHLTENIYLYYYIIQEFHRFLRASMRSRASIPSLPARVCIYIKIQGMQQKY